MNEATGASYAIGQGSVAVPHAPAETTTGYLHPAYAHALTALGSPRYLPAAGGWILERTIAGTARRDGMGCYPLFCCRDWTRLEADLQTLGTDLVAISVVTDPFGEQDLDRLRICFPDLASPFKHHYVVDLAAGSGIALDTHHRRNVRKGLGSVRVEPICEAERCDEDWVRLYSHLTARHTIQGFAAFGDESLRRQLRVPGMVAFKALREGETVGMTIWYVQGSVGYYHLGAYTDIGYEHRASYAIFSTAVDTFRQLGLQWLDLGAGAGLRENRADGLTRFKRGWSTGTRLAYLCGRIYDRGAYADLTRAAGNTGTTYFPAYRAGEHG